MTALSENPALSTVKEATARKNTKSPTTTTVATNPRDFQPVVYSDEELNVMREVQRKLIEEHKVDATKIGPRVLALTTIINKCRTEEAVKGFLKFLEGITMVDIDGFDEDVSSDVEEFLGKCYEPCGVDDQGRRIMWIRGKHAASPDEEKSWIQAGVLYWMAIHADNVSMREGIQFVLDVSNKPKDEYKNSQKLQKINQCYPLRPQAILIAGTNIASRIVINGLIKVASLFAKAKVLQRIKFVTLDDVFSKFSKEDSPQYAGGNAGGIDNVVDWVKERLANFPVPEL